MKDLYIDVGSTNVKWMESNSPTLHLVAFPPAEREEYPYYEVCHEKIFEKIKTIIETCNANRVFFSVQMHGYVLLKNGKAVTPYISWRDERGKFLTPNFNLTKEYGVDIKPNLPRLSLQAQTVDFDEFCTLGSYLVYRLTGENVTHITDGAASGFFNVKEKTCDKVNFKLPRVTYSVKAVGYYKNTIICTPVGDQQATVLGSVEKDYEGIVLNLGTAGQMCCIKKGFVSGNYESRPFFNGKTLCTVTRLIGGGIIAERSDEELEQMLIQDYKTAKDNLPQNKEMIVTGGVVKYRKKLLCNVLDKLNVNYKFNQQCDAINGLKMLQGEN